MGLKLTNIITGTYTSHFWGWQAPVFAFLAIGRCHILIPFQLFWIIWHAWFLPENGLDPVPRYGILASLDSDIPSFCMLHVLL